MAICRRQPETGKPILALQLRCATQAATGVLQRFQAALSVGQRHRHE
ncbi:hypothetical protein GCWU000324_00110 [Kingella oralis ATCC 51147]|uniref:Uncharacterized protein n=1 Tax=Kingella oralis ATCC 51147 TaxID=629741 RepID=C4GEM3_9NEIS|nr:hypothetical protein GCWU000324_00110 [Kingella oralis ATCC 51147]